MSDYKERRVNSFTDRDFGRLEGEVKHLNKQVDELQTKIADMNTKMDVLVSAITEAKGGWKMLMAVGSASALIATGLTKFVIWLKGG